MRSLVSANQAMGLVMFSDVAYELLPAELPAEPRSSSSCVSSLRGACDEAARRSSGRAPGASSAAAPGSRPVSPPASNALRRAGVPHGSLVLMSDLNDSQERPGRTRRRSARRCGGRMYPVRIVPINASPSERPALRRPLRPRARSSGHRPSGHPRSCAPSRSRPPRPGRCSPSASCSSGCSPRTSASTLALFRSRSHESAYAGARPLVAAVGPALRWQWFSSLFALRRARLAGQRSRKTTSASGPNARHTGLWRSPAILPGDPARALLGLGDALAYRRALQLFWLSNVGASTGGQADLGATRVAAEIELQKLMTTGATAEERSTAANLLGVLTVITPEDSATQKAEIATAKRYFTQAVDDDPTNYAPKLNLELVLRIERPRKSHPGSGRPRRLRLRRRERRRRGRRRPLMGFSQFLTPLDALFALAAADPARGPLAVALPAWSVPAASSR